jgi:hypothetical protein
MATPAAGPYCGRHPLHPAVPPGLIVWPASNSLSSTGSVEILTGASATYRGRTFHISGVWAAENMLRFVGQTVDHNAPKSLWVLLAP